MVEEFQGAPGVLMWLLGQREQLRALLDLLRDRGAARGRARRGPGPPSLLALRRDHRAPSRRATRTARWPSPTATSSTSTSSPRSARTSTSSAPTSTAASRRATSSRWSKDEARHPGHVHRVRRRRLEREGDARGPGDAGPLPASASGRRSTSSRAARAGSATPSAASSSSGATAGGSSARTSRLDIHDTQRLLAQRRLRRGLRRGREQHERGVVGHLRQGPARRRGLYELYPRAAYYALQRAFRLDPYAPGTDLAAIRAHFAAIDPVARRARGARRPARACVADVLEPRPR